jgi:DNA gyrase/topoisomerase IV subunit A
MEDQVLKETSSGNMILQGIINIQDDNGYDDDNDEDKGFDEKRRNTNRKKTYEYICKKDSSMIEILQELYRTTSFQSSITMSFIINEKGKLKYVTIRDIVEDWYKIRVDSKRRKHTNAIAQLYNRKHVLEGIRSIFEIMDKVIKTIKENKSNKDGLIKTLHDNYKLTIVQAKGIYEMSLGTLSQFGKEELDTTIHGLAAKIDENEKDLSRIDEIIVNELQEMKKKFGRPRKTTVLLNVEDHKVGAITASKGALLLSYNAIGFFDMNGITDSRNIINGLKQVKVQGKNVRAIISGKGLSNKTPIGFIIAYEDGTINRVPISTFKVINVWYIMNIESLIVSGTPIYSEDDILICLTDDKKLKRIAVKDIPGVRRLQTGSPIIEMCPYNESNKEEDYAYILMVANNGTYHMSDIDDIPLVNRSASGVKSSYDGYQGTLSMLPVPSDVYETERLLIGCTDRRDSQNYIMAYSPSLLKVSGRTSKPHKLQMPEHYMVSSISMVNTEDKTGRVCMIGKGSSTTLSVTNFRKSYEPKRTFITPLVIASI